MKNLFIKTQPIQNQSIKVILLALLVALSLLTASLVTTSVAFAEEDLPDNQSVASVMAPININSADLESLAALKFVGEKKAARIIAYREEHGDFGAVDDLLNVKGIGERTVEENRAWLSVN